MKKPNMPFVSPKPFIKWAGGKGQLLGQLDLFLPKRLFCEDFTYIEPFVGGGAMLFHMLTKFHNLKNVVINDVNEDLIKAYITVMDTPLPLIENLRRMESDYISLPEDKRKERYMEVRYKFNQHNVDDILNTAYFIFLNKTCFNGLYRVNGKGEFNVPFGKYKNPIICNSTTIIADSNALKSCEVKITNGDYQKTFNAIDSKGLTFIYFDPPYRPLTETSSFTSYAKGNFKDEDQMRLADYCCRITSNNCLWMLSNSDCSSQKPNDKFFEELYEGFHINKVFASRSINAKANKRGRLTELLIHSDYETENILLTRAI